VKLESFGDVLKAIGRNKDREFHLLLGNGFSVAYDPDIFSYNALHEFIANLDDEDLSKILGVIQTKNFEIIMQQLDNFSALIDVFGGGVRLKEKIDAASTKLKASLLDAVKELHPQHVFTVPEDESAACSKYLTTFLNTGGKIFSTNYDLLLYWILMRNSIPNHCDGFGRELENPDEFVPPEEQVWSDLYWGKHRAEQNVFYLHGALPFFDAGVVIEKEVYAQHKYLLQNISSRMERGEYPIFVTDGDGDQKLSHIRHNPYLTDCYDNLCAATGSLVTFGFNFGPYDEHIIDAINRAAKFGRKSFPKLLSIYIGTYSDQDRDHINSIAHKFKCKVHIYDATTADVWGRM
jgi:hypothetical protein